MRRFYIPIVLFFFFSLCLSHFQASAQYGNEWIDFNKTYWKFKVGAEGIFRIDKSALDAAGLPSATNGSDYVLYRDGKEVTLFVSNSGLLGSSDYIEFYATGNDGQLDKELYLAANKFTNDNVSLFNDTASYFLMTDNSKPHKRYTAITTPIPGVLPTPSTYCWSTVMANGTANFIPGKTTAPQDYSTSSIIQLYSSQFDNGEGYVLSGHNSALPANFSIATPNLVTGTMNARVQTATIGVARDSNHKVKVFINGIEKANATYGVSDIQRFDFTMPASELSSTNTLTFSHSLTGISDNFFIPFWEVEYPRDWNFNSSNFSRFTVDASSSAQYIEILNFAHGGVAPRLYDLTNNKFYTGDISVSGKTRFYIDASLTRMEMVLYAASSPKIANPSFSKQVNFTNYNLSANQGDYIIITHKNLSKPSGGKDYIQEYKNYRSTAAGGAHAVVVADIEELYDQYAYGIYTHPSSVVHFIDFALEKWSNKPQSVFMIGKGVTYHDYKSFMLSSKAKYFDGIVPTYGSPGSDVGFVSDKKNWKMKVPIGRLSARNADEVANYLNKIKEYEAALLPASFPTPSSELWKKQVLHIAGGDGLSGAGLQTFTLLPTLNYAKGIIEGPKTSATVYTIAKDTKGLPTVAQDKVVDSLIKTGVSLITYYGHGSSQNLDYTIKAPSEYVSLPKLPIFTAYGCEISVIFKPDTLRTLSELYINAPVSGSIAFMASNNQGWTNIHSKYMPILYSHIAQQNYGQTLGNQYRAAHDSFMKSDLFVPGQTSFGYTHVESFLLQGDPATPSAFNAQKPDYYVGAENLMTTPATVTTAVDSFKLTINSFNLARTFSDDSVQVKIEHTDPEGKTSLSKTFMIIAHGSAEKTELWIPIDKTKDLGTNKYKVTVDAAGRYDEISEANNTAMIDVFIFSDNIVPVYPYNFSIVHKPDLTLKASTLNPFKGTGKYRIEIDTTEFFNSPGKLQTTVESKGGVIKWKPGIILKDSVVYYWRTSLDSIAGGTYIWSNSSFIYLQNGSDGWNQSHYFQYNYNNFDSLLYPESRLFQYRKSTVRIRNVNTVMELPAPYVYYNNSDSNRVFRNATDIQRNTCPPPAGSIQVFVFDTAAGQTWYDKPGGTRGSLGPCLGTVNQRGFTFLINTPAGRENARIFLDSIPNGNYVFVRNHINWQLWGNYFTNTWKDDTLIYGAGKSLYHSFLKLGFNTIDSFNRIRLFSMICKKGYTDYPVRQDWSDKINEVMTTVYELPITDVRGKLNSVVIGPAQKWQSMKWRTSAIFDTLSSADSSSVRVSGIDNAGTETFLFSTSNRDTSLALLNTTAYPKLKLQWYNTDTLYHTAPQLDYWRILYDPLPEAALNPAIHYSFTDSVSVGQLMTLSTAIETLTDLPMDSMFVRYKIIDANGVGHVLEEKKFRKLAGNDTLHASVSFDPKPYPGKNYLFIEANPDNKQPEQYHPNNIGYVPFLIKTDEYDPVMDVTFDGIHIMDEDIVSPKPFIKVMLRDENKFLALKDTTSMKLFLRYPGDPDPVRNRIPYDAVCRFVPADMSAGKNEAFIEYKPTFTKDGIYFLYAVGEDASGNGAGAGREYAISFEVVNKSTITNLLNYPNPFSTSTAFVFTLTGSQIPTQFKIQILSVTGKVVREITKQEIGPIHIGPNITEYKWDGKDQYGQVLGNGVYLYRVVTEINGETIERRNKSEIDKFNKNGYGKMYIMR